MDFKIVAATLVDQRCDDARTQLFSIKNQNKAPSWERERQHLLAQSYLLENRTLEALGIFDQLFLNFGSNVNALADLATCYQKLKYWRDFEITVARLDYEFRQLPGQLSYESRIKTRLRLGRFFEELGELWRALELYQDLEVDFQKGPDDALGVRLLARRLRLLSTLKTVGPETESLHSTLLRLDGERTHDILRFEVLRALILAESLLRGPSHAVARVVELFRNSSTTITEAEKLKIVFELIVQMASVGELKSCQQLRDYAEDRLTTSSAFESAVFDLIFNQKVAEFSQLGEQVPHSRMLRLVFLTLRLTQFNDADLLERLLGLRRHLLSGLSPASQELWIQKFPDVKLLKSPQIKLWLDRPLGLMICGERQVSLQASKLILRFASLFVQQEALNFESISRELWGSYLKPNHQRRIRAAVMGLNRLCFELTGASHCWGIEDGVVVRKVPLELV
jgi:hypothetical protein